MSLRQPLRALAIVAVVVSAGCAQPRPTPAPAAPRDLIVLAPSPDGADLGSATVSFASASAELVLEGHALDLRAGQPLPTPVVLPPGEIQRLFGEVLAVIPPPARRFLLYFDLGSDALTAESKLLVSEILATVASRGQPDVAVIGHTDTTGAAAANVELGRRRAALVRDLLVGAGLAPTLIEVASHGETNPVEPTPDNTENARNRRVEVTVR
jgi:peptidoglycan-associated lipoprotein